MCCCMSAGDDTGAVFDTYIQPSLTRATTPTFNGSSAMSSSMVTPGQFRRRASSSHPSSSSRSPSPETKYTRRAYKVQRVTHDASTKSLTPGEPMAVDSHSNSTPGSSGPSASSYPSTSYSSSAHTPSSTDHLFPPGHPDPRPSTHHSDAYLPLQAGVVAPAATHAPSPIPILTTSNQKVLPATLAKAELDDVLTMVADMLTRLLQHNDSLPSPESDQSGRSPSQGAPPVLTRFHSRVVPGISVRDYLVRIARYTSLEKVCLLLILVYIDRVAVVQSQPQQPSTTTKPSNPPTTSSSSSSSIPNTDDPLPNLPPRETVETDFAATVPTTIEPTFTLCSLTVHRFVCAAIVCSSKALCDSFAINAHYARVGGISLQELNVLERELLRLIRWKMVVRIPSSRTLYTPLGIPLFRLTSLQDCAGSKDPPQLTDHLLLGRGFHSAHPSCYSSTIRPWSPLILIMSWLNRGNVLILSKLYTRLVFPSLHQPHEVIPYPLGPL